MEKLRFSHNAFFKNKEESTTAREDASKYIAGIFSVFEGKHTIEVPDNFPFGYSFSGHKNGYHFEVKYTRNNGSKKLRIARKEGNEQNFPLKATLRMEEGRDINTCQAECINEKGVPYLIHNATMLDILHTTQDYVRTFVNSPIQDIDQLKLTLPEDINAYISNDNTE